MKHNTSKNKKLDSKKNVRPTEKEKIIKPVSGKIAKDQPVSGKITNNQSINAKKNKKEMIKIKKESAKISSLTKNQVGKAPSDQQPSVSEVDDMTKNKGLAKYRDACTETKFEDLGPISPGNQINLSGVVWHESKELGMLVVNVTWRGRNYIGCLTDSNNECQKNRSASEARQIEALETDGMRSKFGRSKRHRNFGTNSESTGISSIIGVRGKGRTGRLDDKEKSSPSKRKHKQNVGSPSGGSSEQMGEQKSKRLKLNTSRNLSPAASRQNTPTNESEESELVSESTQDKAIFECNFNGCRKKYFDKRGLDIHENYQHSKEITQKAINKLKNLKKVAEDDFYKESTQKDLKNKSTNLVKDSSGDSNLKVISNNQPKMHEKISSENQDISKTSLPRKHFSKQITGQPIKSKLKQMQANAEREKAAKEKVDESQENQQNESDLAVAHLLQSECNTHNDFLNILETSTIPTVPFTRNSPNQTTSSAITATAKVKSTTEKNSLVQKSSLYNESEGVFMQANKEKEDSKKVSNQPYLNETRVTNSEKIQSFNNDLSSKNLSENKAVQNLKPSNEKLKNELKSFNYNQEERNQNSVASMIKSSSSNRNLTVTQTPTNKNPVVVAGTFHPFPDPKKPEIAVSALAQDRLRQQHFQKLSPSRIINQVEPLPGPQKARVIPMQKGMPHPSATSSQVKLKVESSSDSNQNKLVKLDTSSAQGESKAESETNLAAQQAQNSTQNVKLEETKTFSNEVEDKSDYRKKSKERTKVALEEKSVTREEQKTPGFNDVNQASTSNQMPVSDAMTAQPQTLNPDGRYPHPIFYGGFTYPPVTWANHEIYNQAYIHQAQLIESMINQHPNRVFESKNPPVRSQQAKEENVKNYANSHPNKTPQIQSTSANENALIVRERSMSNHNYQSSPSSKKIQMQDQQRLSQKPQLSELADSRAHNRGQKETRTSEQLISSTEVGASYGPPSNEVTISHRSPNINFLRTSSPQIKTQHNETNKAPLNHHYEHNKAQPHPSSSSETNSKHTFGSLPANIPHSMMGIPLLLDQIRMQKISGIQQVYGQQGVTVPHISQTQISTAMAGSRWPPYLYPAGLMTAGTQLSPHHSRFVPTPSHHSESPKVNNNGKTSEPSSGVTLNKQPPISSHNNRYQLPLPQSQLSTQVNAHFTEQKRLENKFSNMKHQQQGIRGNVTSNNKQTPPRLNTDGKPYSSQLDTYKPTHLQQPRLLNSVQHNPSLSRTPSSSLQRNPPDPRVTPNSIQKTPSDQRLPQEMQRFMSPIPFQKGIPIFNQNPLASSLLAAQQAAFAYPGLIRPGIQPSPPSSSAAGVFNQQNHKR